jgi:hypothetical protein
MEARRMNLRAFLGMLKPKEKRGHLYWMQAYLNSSPLADTTRQLYAHF